MELPTTCGPHSNKTPTVEVIVMQVSWRSLDLVYVNLYLPGTIKTAKQI